MPASQAQGLVLDWAGEHLVLRPERALHLPEHDAVLVADFHLGKAHSFRRLGLPVPTGTTQDNLDRLDVLLARTGASQLVFLGDFLHSASVQSSLALTRFESWRKQRPGLAMTLVRGNHDDRAGDPPAALGITVVDEPWALGGLALCHHPFAPRQNRSGEGQDASFGTRVAGHWHPGAVLRGRAHDTLRLPCFVLDAGQLVLPAFGSFTGLHTVEPGPGIRRWVSDGERVVELR